jgi:hypothetical protein
MGGASGAICMIDFNLRKDLAAIAAEVKLRKKTKPFIPYSFWAFTERLAAMYRYEQRQEKNKRRK